MRSLGIVLLRCYALPARYGKFLSYIETQRLLLRTWMESDFADAMTIFGDEETMRAAGGARSPKRVKAMIDRMMERQNNEEPALWPAILKSEMSFVGVCGLIPLESSGDIEIGWHFARRVWGMGLAYEASSAVLKYGFEELQLERIVCVIHPMNRRSIALANRLGFRFERVARHYGFDLLRYAKSRSAVIPS